MPRLVAGARSLDRQLFAAVARTDSPRLDAVVPWLTSSADHGGLWFAVAGALAITGRDGRRAAVRGLVSLSVASGLANGPAKWTFRRQRPSLSDVPVLRQLAQQPRTTSFPSGHSASAAAFATGVALEAPLILTIPVVAAAAGVAYGRVYTGVHYPSDVAVGVALGAAAAVVVRRVWPTRPDQPAAATAPPRTVPRLPKGDGLVIVVNAAAASVEGEVDALTETVRLRLPAAQVILCEDGTQLHETLADAAGRARVLGVAGGDGTVSTAAGIALQHEIPLLVVPVGTLNHFAGAIGVSDIDAACDAVAAGDAVEISVASAGDGMPFLNTFSLGVYPELVRRRERREDIIGKWPALAVALVEVLGRAQPVELEIDGEPQLVWLVFGGNGRYHPAGFAPSWRERLDEGVVDVRVVRADRRWARVRLVAAVLTGRLGRCRVYSERIVDDLALTFRGAGERELARDGESEPAPRHLRLSAADRLVVYRPAR